MCAKDRVHLLSRLWVLKLRTSGRCGSKLESTCRPDDRSWTRSGRGVDIMGELEAAPREKTMHDLFEKMHEAFEDA